MPIGPGKYDDLCTMVREKAAAMGAIVIIFEGNQGSGFSVQGDLPSIAAMPRILEIVAAEMRKSK